MALLYDRIGFETASTGTGAIVAGAALEGMRTFAQAGAVDGQSVRYLIEQGAAWELVEGVLSASATTISRANTLASSNSGSPINLASGGAQVFCVPMARDVNKTAATLTHTAGAITLDAQAADVFRFEADAYTPPSTITFLGSAANTSGGNISLTGMGLAENDVVILISQGSGTTPSGYTVLRIGGGTDGARINAYYKKMGASPDTTVASGASTAQALAICLRGIDPTNTLDTTVAYNDASNKTNANAPAVTTVTAGAYVLALLGVRNFDPAIPQGTVSGYTHLATTSDTYGGSSIDINISAFGKTVAAPGTEDPPAHSETVQGAGETTIALRPVAEVGENDYTFTFSNIPASGIASGKIDIELKTDTGTVAFAGGTVSWRGQVPAFDEVGHYLIGFDADVSGITLWRIA